MLANSQFVTTIQVAHYEEFYLISELFKVWRPLHVQTQDAGIKMTKNKKISNVLHYYYYYNVLIVRLEEGLLFWKHAETVT